ncbi:DUF4157 domain-containing protein [Pseudanabaena sp. SR411]|uniref:eCIS core domain-containing protein n=1 Tax=Pseudanabaena sp. SR411 TaxID=1980935 RepID=UPI000B981F3B|nr:DUF4157 domain-containing protein [Pseudanabaena sp. SR411]
MSRISDFAKKPSQSTTSVQPTTSFLQTRDFAPLQMDFDEDAISRSSRNGDNLLEKIINQGSIEPSGTPVQAKPINRLKPLQAKRMATIQAKLSIGELNDKYEQEADATASKVVQQINSPTQDQSVQRQDSMEEEDELQMKPISSIQRQDSMEEEDELQMKSFVQRRENLGGGEASTDLESSIQSARGSGQSLDHNLQDKIGQAMGADFSDVKIHTDSQSDQLNQSIQSKAFTTGQDVFFRKGTYNPSSKEGQELITHELTHVVQQNGGDVQRSPHIHEKLQHPTSNKTSRLESNSQIQKIKEVPSRLQPKMIQRKGEFKAQFQKNSDIAKAAVKADYASYADYQKNFEIKLGAGLYKNKHAMDGANIMLGKMQVAMIAAGFDEEKVDKAFALSKGEELGGVLLEDVNQAIISGNLREKMGMVYQARFAIAEALNAIRKDPKIPLGEEIQSEEMGKSIEELGREHPSQAILKRRDSVNNQAREGNKDPKQKSITGEYLKELGVPLSEREQKAAKEQEVNGKKDRRFIPGSEYYKVNPKQKAKEQDQLRRVVSGLSGSTDMYFHIAKHLNMDESERKLLRLAALGQMIVNNDHSYHEIMHVAKTQGGLTDYPDDLPIGYTTLDPLSEDDITNTATLGDFPGDKQVKDSMQELTITKEDITKVGGDAGKRSHKYPAILAKVDEYHQNPKIETLEEIKRLVDVWINDKKPGSLAFQKTKTQWENSPRRKKLIELKNEADRLLKVESEYLKLDLASAKFYILDQLANAPDDKKSVIQKKMENFIDSYIQKATKDASLGKKLDKVSAQKAQRELEEKKKELNKIKTLLTGTTDDWQSKDFRAKKSDLDRDLSKVDIPDTGIYGTLSSPLKADLKSDLKSYTIDNREIIETLGGDVSNIPDLREKKTLSPLQEKMAKKLKDTEQENIRNSPTYTKDQDDFIDNIDTSMLEALKPGTPMDNLLRQVEGKPMPQELEAINAYAQDGFYTMMNKILNNSKNKEFMKQVPEEAKALVSLAVSGLRKMQPYEGGSVYRGEHGGLNSRYVNDLIKKPKTERQKILEGKFKQNEHYSQFISTSKRPYQAYSTKAGKWLAMEIRNVKSGVDISAISNTLSEREVLFPPNVTLKVISVEDKFATKVGSTLTDLENKYAEAPIDDKEGRVKVVYEEV